MCFSATVPPKIKEVLQHVLKPDHVKISTIDESEPPTIDGVPQFSVVIPKAEDSFSAILSLVNAELSSGTDQAKIIVFGTTANLAALYADLYRQLLPLEIFELHSRLNQNQRTRTTDAFRAATKGIMLATDGMFTSQSDMAYLTNSSHWPRNGFPRCVSHHTSRSAGHI